MSPSYRIRTIGCKVNQFDSSALEGVLKDLGLRPAGDGTADLCVINTCTVTNKSDSESRALVRRMARENPGARIVVTGCYAQVGREEIEKMDEVDLVLSRNAFQDLNHFLIENNIIDWNSTGNTQVESLQAEAAIGADGPDGLRYETSRSRAFLRIQEGCNNRCTYCIVWRARGRSRSSPVEQVLAAAREIEARGFLEVVLTGIHIGDYGRDQDPVTDLAGLVGRILRATKRIRIRVSSIEPNEISPALVDLIAGESRVCRHLHVPLQSATDAVLERMGRSYRLADYRRIVENLKARVPGICIGADVIAGFPGESARDFDAAERVIDALPVDYLHVFPYSKRKGTPAAVMDGQVHGLEKKDRARRLRRISGRHMERFYSSSIGGEVNVIHESDVDNGLYSKCISDNYLKLFVPRDRLDPSGVTWLTVQPEFIRPAEESGDKERRIIA